MRRFVSAGVSGQDLGERLARASAVVAVVCQETRRGPRAPADCGLERVGAHHRYPRRHVRAQQVPSQLERPRPGDRGDEPRGVRSLRLECGAEQVQPELARLRAQGAQSVARSRRAILEARRRPARGSLLVGGTDGVEADQELEGRA